MARQASPSPPSGSLCSCAASSPPPFPPHSHASSSSSFSSPSSSFLQHETMRKFPRFVRFVMPSRPWNDPDKIAWLQKTIPRYVFGIPPLPSLPFLPPSPSPSIPPSTIQDKEVFPTGAGGLDGAARLALQALLEVPREAGHHRLVATGGGSGEEGTCEEECSRVEEGASEGRRGRRRRRRRRKRRRTTRTRRRRKKQPHASPPARRPWFPSMEGTGSPSRPPSSNGVPSVCERLMRMRRGRRRRPRRRRVQPWSSNYEGSCKNCGSTCTSSSNSSSKN